MPGLSACPLVNRRLSKSIVEVLIHKLVRQGVDMWDGKQDGIIDFVGENGCEMVAESVRMLNFSSSGVAWGYFGRPSGARR